MKTVIRHDRAQLRKPSKTSQGFLRVDGYIGRVGIYEYRNDDGSIRRELRPREEVFSPTALESADAASMTIGHPREDVTAKNVREHEVGAVSGKAWEDGEHAAASFVVKDAKAIDQISRGKKQLSPGYRIDLDETPGEDPRYAYPGNPRGRYDAVQRNIRVNHVALVERARGGSSVALRLDEAERVDGCGKLTTIVGGHQHLIDLEGGFGGDRYSGSTSWATAEGSEQSHDHPWIRSADGSITIGESAGHTHAILDDGDKTHLPLPAAFGAEIDRYATRGDSGGMTTPNQPSPPPPDAAEQIRLLTVRADEAERAANQRRDALDQANRAAEGFRAELATARERISVLEVQIESGAALRETAALTEQRRRADEAERTLSEERAAAPEKIRKRARLLSRAHAVLGQETRLDAMSDREILATAIRRIRPKEDTGAGVSVDYLERRFDSLLDERMQNASSLSRAAEVMSSRRDGDGNGNGNGAAPTKWSEQWKNGAGQYATRKER